MDVGNPSNMKRILNIYHDIESLRNDLCSWSFNDEDTKKQIIKTLKEITRVSKNSYICKTLFSIEIHFHNKHRLYQQRK